MPTETDTLDRRTLADYEANLRSDLRRAKESGRPLLVTHEGEVEAIVLSPEAYQALVDDAERGRIIQAIAESKRQIAAGEYRSLEQSLRDTAARLGLTLPQ